MEKMIYISDLDGSYPILFAISSIFFLLFIGSMSQRPFSPVTNEPFKVYNYYLQILITQLVCKTPASKENSKYTFSIYKGDREFEKTKEVTVPLGHQGPLPLDKFKLNFVVTSYNPGSHNDFILKMILEVDSIRAKEIGEYMIDANQYIDQYNISDNGAFTMTIDINDDFAAELELYVDRNQHGLFRLIRDIKNPKPKKENEFQTPQLQHQRIIQRRRAMDRQAEEEKGQNSKDKRFSRFSPKKDALEDKHKRDDFLNKKKKEEEKLKSQAEEQKLVEGKEEEKEEEKKKNKKKEPVVKPEWMIPAAEKYLKNKEVAKIKRKSSKGSQQKEPSEDGKTKANESSKVKSNVIVIQPSLGERLRSPAVMIILLLIMLATGYFLVLRPSLNSQPDVPNKKKGGKPAKVEKAQPKAKGKVSKK